MVGRCEFGAEVPNLLTEARLRFRCPVLLSIVSAAAGVLR